MEKIIFRMPNKKIRKPENKKPFNLPLIVILGFVLILLIILGIFFLDSKENKNSSETISANSELTEELILNGEEVGEIEIGIEADLEVVSNCENLSCFEEKFTECQPTTISYQLTESLIYFYEIVGLKNGLCEVKSKFTENPNPDWVNKEMTCLYDNSKDFETAIQDMSNCEGELYDLMIGFG